MKPLKIGDITIENGLVLAPMAGYTDRAMRLVCHECGAEFSYTEMVSAKGVCFGDKKTGILARIRADEGPVGIQIFGSEPEIMARAAEELERGFGESGYVRPALIDINFGCPVNKIFSNGEGSALMKDPEKIYRIVRAVSSAISIPCTVKMRSGIDASHINATECALAAEEGGAVALALHGRTRVQMYGGLADREIIRKVKNSLHIPLIANGDITDADSAEAMLRDTGADGIMIGRGAVGNPFLFSEISARLKGETYEPPTVFGRAEIAKKQLRLAIEDKGERVAVSEARKQIALYFKGFRGSAAMRAKINSSESFAEVCLAIEECVRLESGE